MIRQRERTIKDSLEGGRDTERGTERAAVALGDRHTHVMLFFKCKNSELLL